MGYLDGQGGLPDARRAPHHRHLPLLQSLQRLPHLVGATHEVGIGRHAVEDAGGFGHTFSGHASQRASQLGHLGAQAAQSGHLCGIKHRALAASSLFQAVERIAALAQHLAEVVSFGGCLSFRRAGAEQVELPPQSWGGWRGGSGAGVEHGDEPGVAVAAAHQGTAAIGHGFVKRLAVGQRGVELAGEGGGGVGGHGALHGHHQRYASPQQGWRRASPHPLGGSDRRLAGTQHHQPHLGIAQGGGHFIGGYMLYTAVLVLEDEIALGSENPMTIEVHHVVAAGGSRLGQHLLGGRAQHVHHHVLLLGQGA